MSLRPGNNKKKAQRYQNVFAFKHNKNSMTTRKILSVPLDFLCERCLDKMEWRLSYRKYKPLTTPSRCNLCQEKNIYKAYRTICETCAMKDNKKLCTKCNEEVENYARPDCRNDPNAKKKTIDPVFDVVQNLKQKYRNTVYRKIKDGAKIGYDETKGIINKDTGEVIVYLENFGDLLSDDDDEEGDDVNEEDILDAIKEDQKDEVINKDTEIKAQDKEHIEIEDEDKYKEIEDEEDHGDKPNKPNKTQNKPKNKIIRNKPHK